MPPEALKISELVRVLLGRRLAEVDARIADLRSLRRTLADLLASSDAQPRASACVCKIIESHTLTRRVHRRTVGRSDRQRRKPPRHPSVTPSVRQSVHKEEL